MSNVDFNRLQETFSYDPKTGVLTNRKTGNVIAATTNGYLAAKVAGVTMYAHRIAWALTFGRLPNGHIDHINGNRSDNRLENLRDANDLVNNHNRRRANKSNRSCGLLGVTKPKHTKKWAASITINRKRIHIGYFYTPKEAHAAYLKAKAIHHPTAPHLFAF